AARARCGSGRASACERWKPGVVLSRSSTSIVELAQNLGQFGLQITQVAVVCDDEVRSLRLFVLCEVAGGARLDERMTARSRALGADGLVRDHGDRLVEHVLHPGLEQQRNLDDRRRRILYGRAELRNPLADA